MEVCESERRQTLETKPRPPLVPAEKLNNAIATRRPRIREVSSRYKSPTPSRTSPSSAAVRASSPTAARTVRSPVSSAPPKRSVSADRKRPSTPPSPSTPAKDSAATATRRTGGRGVAAAAAEGLWPSTMRSLSVSFQSDSISIPVSVSKKEKTVSSNALSDRTLRTSSSNVAHRQAESTVGSPRKRSPLRAKTTGGSDQSENSKPVDGLHSRLIDQHRWPSRVGGKISSVGITNSNSASLHKSMDLGPRIVRLTATPAHHHQSSSRAGMERANSVDDSSLHKLDDTSLSERLSLAVPKVRSLSRPSSPSKGYSSSVPRGVTSSPAGSRPSTPPSRGVSPSRTRASGTTSCHSSSSNATSVLSFIADFKGKKSTGYIEDAHQLRLLHNRFLQWRFANARAEAVLYAQKVTAERTLLNVWNTTLSLWDSVIRKRVKLQQLNLELKLNSVLNDQMGCLEDWALLERDHIAAFSGAMEDLEASTLRLPVTGGARTDIESLKIAICSAVDVMQAMGSSICSLLSRVEGVNGLVSELAVVAAQEKAMIDECEALLASAAVMQVEEYSLRTQLVQMKQDFGIVSGQFWQPRHHLLDPD